MVLDKFYYSKTVKYFRLGVAIGIAFILVGSVNAFATTLTCVIPERSDERQDSEVFIKLEEPKTVIFLDKTNKVAKFNTPGCHKFKSISHWTNNFIITCDSNNGAFIELEVDTIDLTFFKTYFDTNQKSHYQTGFCKRLD